MGFHGDCTIAGRDWLRKHGAVLISVFDSKSLCSAVDFAARVMGSKGSQYVD